MHQRQTSAATGRFLTIDVTSRARDVQPPTKWEGSIFEGNVSGGSEGGRSDDPRRDPAHRRRDTSHRGRKPARRKDMKYDIDLDLFRRGAHNPSFFSLVRSMQG